MLGFRRAPAVEPGAFWKQQGWILSAGFLVAVLIISGLVFLVGNVGGGSDDEVTVSGPLSTGAPRDDSGRPTGCSTDDSDTSMPERAPINVEWRTVGTAKIPVSATAGPRETYETMLWCFSRTPIGAAVAAQVISTQLETKDWALVADQQMLAGKPRDWYIRIFGPTAYKSAAQNPAVTGFAVTDYTENTATVELLAGNTQTILGSGSTFMAKRINLVWDGDWKVLPTSTGRAVEGWYSLDSSNGFISWEA